MAKALYPSLAGVEGTINIIYKKRSSRSRKPGEHPYDVIARYNGSAGLYPRKAVSFRDTVLSFLPLEERVIAVVLERSIRSIQCIRRNSVLRGFIPDKKMIARAVAGKLKDGDLIWWQALKKNKIPYRPLPGNRNFKSSDRNSLMRKLSAGKPARFKGRTPWQLDRIS